MWLIRVDMDGLGPNKSSSNPLCSSAFRVGRKVAVMVGKARPTGLEGPNEAGSEARPYSWASQVAVWPERLSILEDRATLSLWLA